MFCEVIINIRLRFLSLYENNITMIIGSNGKMIRSYVYYINIEKVILMLRKQGMR